MTRRFLLGIIVVLFAFVPALGAGVAAQVGEGSIDVQFGCFKDGSAQLTGENHHPDRSISMTVLSQTSPTTQEDLGSITLGPGESRTLNIGPGTRVGGWNILVESLEPGGGSLFTVPYPRDCFPFSDPEPDVTAPVPTSTTVPPPTAVPPANSFSLLTAIRMCSDQSFRASWSGSNIIGLEFSLTNTSDEWTTGWFDADPSAGSLSLPVDHHSYDKVMAMATFEDGTSDTVSLNLGACTESPAPPSAADPLTTGPQHVKSLPSTGSGSGANMAFVMSMFTLALASLVAAGSLRQRK